MSTQTLGDTRVDPVTGEPIVSHIVAPKDGKTGATLAMEARLYGTPVEALCGHVFTPQHDPKQVPPCQKCDEIFRGKFKEGDPSDA